MASLISLISLLFHLVSSCFTWLPCIDHPQNGDHDQCYGRKKAHNARRAVIFGNVGPHLQGSWNMVEAGLDLLESKIYVNFRTCAEQHGVT